MSTIDLQIFEALYGGPQGRWAPVMIALTILGSGWSALALVPLACAPGTRRIALALSGAIGAQATVVWLVKRVVGRVRPWVAMGLPAPIGAPHNGSFPSGHAAGSFCVAAFLAVVLPSLVRRARARWLAGLLFVVAALVGWSRVYLAAHFPSDVFAGALLGGVIGVLAGRLYAASSLGPETGG